MNLFSYICNTLKKYFIIFFSFFYLLVSSGFTINYHYCGGKLKKVSLVSFNEKGCCGNKKKSKGCCKDKVSFIKIKDNHKANNFIKVPPTNYITVKTEPILLFISLLNSCNEKNITNYHSPPVIYDNPLYLKHQEFLI